MNEITVTNEKAWAKKLKASQNKTREWLFRHAVELYEFKIECEGQSGYYGTKVKEWLGYSNDLASKWASAGSFIVRVTKSFEASRLPASMSTLVEFSRMSDEEFQAAEEYVLRANVTVAEVQQFRLSYKDKQKPEPEVLHFKYTKAVPEHIVQAIEELAEEFGVDNVPYTLTFEDRYICTRISLTWGCTDSTEEKVGPRPKPEPEPEEKTISQFEQDLITLGINFEKKKVERWALAGLLKSAKQVYHPDKLGNEEIFKTIPDIEKRLS